MHNLLFSYLNDRIAEGKNSTSKTKRTPYECDSLSRVCPHCKNKPTRQEQLIGLEEISMIHQLMRERNSKKFRSYDRHANIVLFILNINHHIFKITKVVENYS